MRLFFDESGNSGTDVYDPDQPVLAYAGAWLDASNESHFRRHLSFLRKSNTTETPSSSSRVASGAISRRMRADASTYCCKLVMRLSASVASHSSSQNTTARSR
jgi:hypothetical protein